VKKTQEQLDAEMEDYFNPNSGPEPSGSGTANSGANTVPDDDTDMGIE